MKKRFEFESIQKVLIKIKKYADIMAIVGVFYILLYQITTLRNICKAVWSYVSKWYFEINFSLLKNVYFFAENIFRIIIVFSIISSILIYVIKWCGDKKLQRKKGENRFEESLFRYLKDKTVSRSFLITGRWGSGKTYEVNRFFNKYYRYSNTRIYRVSCFGLSTRKELIEEINNVIEKEDSSFYALIIKVMQYLPVIGDAVYKLLKKTYSYDSVKTGSIFIFDDFERVTSRAITNNYSGELYRQSPFLLNSVTRGSDKIKELCEIKDEFKSIKMAFSKIEDFVNKNSLREDYDKYIAIIGLINELVETYDMKVIIICNSDVLGEKFVQDVLRSKLNCTEYKKVITSEVKVSIVDNIIKNRIIDDIEKQKKVEEYLRLVKTEIETVVLDNNFKDLRLFSGWLEAFVDTAQLFDSEMLSNEFLNSLLNSMLVTHIAFYTNAFEQLDTFITGANIEFLIDLFGVPVDTSSLVRLTNNACELKWVDMRVSGYWILNLSVPNDVAEVYEEWDKYGYYMFEDAMIKNHEALNCVKKYDLVHLLFYNGKINRDKRVTYDYRPYIVNALRDYDLSSVETVQYILNITHAAFRYVIYMDFQKVLFEVLAEGCLNKKVMGISSIHNDYNEFVDNKVCGEDTSEAIM